MKSTLYKQSGIININMDECIKKYKCNVCVYIYRQACNEVAGIDKNMKWRPLIRTLLTHANIVKTAIFIYSGIICMFW